mmetsp:Transcript_72958/g.211212  ORF Transcript_72958/g.211212 Transcript_72958/m.211212 type:complete len:212 (-) Transcript_72958:284-919(-)
MASVWKPATVERSGHCFGTQEKSESLKKPSAWHVTLAFVPASASKPGEGELAAGGGAETAVLAHELRGAALHLETLAAAHPTRASVRLTVTVVLEALLRKSFRHLAELRFALELRRGDHAAVVALQGLPTAVESELAGHVAAVPRAEFAAAAGVDAQNLLRPEAINRLALRGPALEDPVGAALPDLVVAPGACRANHDALVARRLNLPLRA